MALAIIAAVIPVAVGYVGYKFAQGAIRKAVHSKRSLEFLRPYIKTEEQLFQMKQNQLSQEQRSRSQQFKMSQQEQREEYLKQFHNKSAYTRDTRHNNEE